MTIKSTVVFVTALTLAACGSSPTPSKTTTTTTTTGTGTTGSTTGGSTTGGTTGEIGTNPANPNGLSTLSTNSPVVVNATGKTIKLPYVIFAAQAAATDANKIYGIEFQDYDPCTQGTEFGWSTWPITTYNQMGFYFPSAPKAGTYSVGSAAGDIIAANGALGEGFSATQNPNGSYTCKASTWASLAGGNVTITAADSNSVTGTIAITLSDGSTVTGKFKSGTCSATATGGVLNPNGAACTSEK